MRSSTGEAGRAADGLWSAYDIAAYLDRSVDWVWRALARWRESGLVEPVGEDSITGAAVYRAEQVRAAWRVERDSHRR